MRPTASPGFVRSYAETIMVRSESEIAFRSASVIGASVRPPQAPRNIAPATRRSARGTLDIVLIGMKVAGRGG